MMGILPSFHVMDSRRTFLVLLSTFWILLEVSAVLDVPSFTEFRFTIEPSDTVTYEGTSLRLDCAVTYSKSTIPVIRWLKNDEYLQTEQERRFHLADNGSLHISSVVDKKAATDAGDYQCSATTTDGQTIISRKASVQIAAISRSFDIEPQDVEVYFKDTAAFQCKIKSIPSANVSWFKDDTLIRDVSGKSRTYPEGVLEVYDVQFDDFGVYHCLAEGVDKTRRSRDAKLTQKNAEEGFQGIKPGFSLRPRDTAALAGSKVILFCGAYGLGSKMQPPTLSWLKDGRTIDFSKGNGRVTMIGGGHLQILNVQTSLTSVDTSQTNRPGDVGLYTCRAENDVDSNDAEAELTVLVPPTFKKQPQKSYAHVKRDANLECEASGIPTPTISWYKNGDPVTPNGYYWVVEGQTLQILGLLPSDSGFYQCFAENSAGQIQSTAQLMVLQQDIPLSANPSTPSIYYHVQRSGAYPAPNPQDVPSQPTSLLARIVSQRFVTLTWGVPAKKGLTDIVAYSIRWQEMGSERERVTNTTTLDVNIQRLKPGTEYEFRVAAYNRNGATIAPAYLKLRTQEEDDVPSKPENMKVVVLSPTSIRVTWDPPAQPKATIVSYELLYYRVGADTEEPPVSIVRTASTYIVDDLLKFHEYSFRLVAVNENGPGMSTEEISVRTWSDKPSDVPQNFTLETTSSTSIVVRWQPPPSESRNGKIIGYKIRYKKKGSGRGSTVTTDGDRVLYALTDLKKDINYQVRISAQTVNGSGPSTLWQYARTYEDDLDESDVPDMPDRLLVRPLTNALIVQWVPNRRSKSLVRGYYLGYGKGIPDVYRQVFDSDTFAYTIENLQPASEYVVSIRAYNDKGQGQPRYETVFTEEITDEEPVSSMLPPIGLKAIVLSATSIVLSWTDTTLGKIQRISDSRFYTVRYNSIAPRRSNKFINVTDLNCHIDDLKPNTQYEFSVKVFKGKRKSTWSMSVTNTTLESAPGTMPRDLTPVPLEDNPLAVTLNWQPPAKPNGQITGYLVFYTTDPSKDDLEWVVEGVIGEKLSMTITDLTEDTTYYFKVQARNSKGYGPMSNTVIHTTPKDVSGWGDLSGGKPRSGSNPDDGTDSDVDKVNKAIKEGVSQNLMIIIIACVVGVTFCVVVAVVTVILCRKRDSAERNRRLANMYGKGTPNSVLGVKQGLPPGRDGQPPDLWIDHDLELRPIGKYERAESSISVGSTRRNSHDTRSIDTNPAEIYAHSGSEAEEKLLPPSYHQLQQQPQRNIIRPKPLNIPVDPREAVAQVQAYPNGHLMQRYQGGTPNCPTTPTEDQGGMVPMRPVYPRTQYQMQYVGQGPPRVNAGDISQASMHGFPTDHGYRLVPCLEEDDLCHPESLDDSCLNRVGYGIGTPDPHSAYNSLTRRGRNKTPITGIASPLKLVHSTGSLDRAGDRLGNPMKSFTVPDPPLSPVHHHCSRTPNLPKHIVKPQQTSTPYKKPAAPISSGPIKPRAVVPVVSPKAPDVVLKPGEDDPDHMEKSLSTEELTAEMANLEGLMKDLNAITQQDFEC